MAVGERGRGDPFLECFIVTPSGHDEPLGASIGRPQKLETFEAVLIVDSACPSGESAG
jgi:hypothetical protein